MPNNDEETKKLYDLDELKDANNEIFEVNEKKEEIERPDLDFFMKPPENIEEPKKGEKKRFAKIKNWWKKLNKKQKILWIIGFVIIFIILCVGIFFLVKTFMKKPKEEIEHIVVQKENYRYDNGRLIFLDNDTEIGSYTCQNGRESLCYVAYFTNEDTFDVEKKIHEDGSPLLTRSPIYNGNYVFVFDNVSESDKKIFLYNIKEEKVEEVYHALKEGNTTSEVILKDINGHYGVLSITDNITPKIEFNYDYLGYIANGTNNYVSIQNNQTMLMNETGNVVSKVVPGEIKNYTKDYIKVKTNLGYEVYDYSANHVFEESFEYVDLYNDYAVLIKDKKMNLKFYDKHKLNEESIPLYNDDYVKKSIYDQKNHLKETKQSYSIEENDNIITIHAIKESGSTSITVNKAEGNLNKSLKNINYFNGKLYIYRDAEKINLLGSYSCSNKNNVTNETTNLTNCKIAKDTVYEDNDYEIPGNVGVIPVFNERFVFFEDNPDLVNDSNKTVVVYDLKANNVIGKYSEVNTYSYTGTEELTFQTVTNHQVVAKNISGGNFGVIKIGSNEVSGHISFNYSGMESLHDYYVAKDVNGYLLISKTNGASVTSAITYKIRNYNDVAKYVKVLNNGKYFIYNFQNGPLSLLENGYNYIELYDYFFAAVDNNNKLSLYTYEKPRNNLIDSNYILLESPKDFKITTSGTSYAVFVGNETVPRTTGTVTLED